MSPFSTQALPSAFASRIVLIVDDDVLVLRALTRTVSSFGLTVVATSKPIEALEMVLAESQRFSLIITDVDMPGLPGDELLDRIATAGIDLPAILISGRFPCSSPTEHWLAKPCSKSEIRAALVAQGILSARPSQEVLS